MNEVIKPEIWESFVRGERLACSRIISRIENNPSMVPAIRDRLIPMQKGAVRVGITGPPGVGKSTVTAALTRHARRNGQSVGIVAVDPSSPFTGGAFLGDRVRMQELVSDSEVFIRSLASRDGHGGVSPATPYVAEVLDAWGVDLIFIETVGVGQAELDILNCTDVIILVMQPGTGDAIQAMKAGILEAGDLILINKADLDGADSLEESLRFIFELSPGTGELGPPPIIPCSANRDDRIDTVFATLMERIDLLRQTGRFAAKRKDLLERDIRTGVRNLLWRKFLDITGVEPALTTAAVKLADSGGSPYPVIREMFRKIKMTPADGDDSQ